MPDTKQIVFDDINQGLDTTSEPIEQYSPLHNSSLLAPPNTSSGALDYEISFQGGYPQDRMFGDYKPDTVDEIARTSPKKLKSLVKGAASSVFDLTLGFQGDVASELGERLQEDETEITEERGPESILKSILLAPSRASTALNELIGTEGLVKPLSAVLESFGVRGDVAEELISIGEDYRAMNDKIIVENNLDFVEGEDSSFFRQLGAGATSLGAAVALTMVTKSPHAAAVYFGALEQSSIYKESREAGNDINSSVFWSDIGGFASGLLEYMGTDILFKGFKRGIIKGTVQGSVGEGLQEGSQEVAGIATREFGDIEHITLEEGLKRVGTSAAVGSILGGGVGGSGAAVSSVKDNIKSKPVDGKLVEGEAVEGQQPRDEVGGGLEEINNEIRAVIQSLNTEMEIIKDSDNDTPALKSSTKAKENKKTAIDIATGFKDGVPIKDIHKTDEQKTAGLNKGIAKIEKMRAETGEIAKSGRLDILEREELEIVEQIASLGEQGEEFLIALHEAKDISKDVEALAPGITEAAEAVETQFDFAMLQLQAEEAEQIATEISTEEFEASAGFRRIEEKANKLRAQLAIKQREIDELGDVEGRDALSAIGKNRVEVRATVLKKVADSNINSLMQGVKIGEQFSEKQGRAVRDFFSSIISALPAETKPIHARLQQRANKLTKPGQLPKAIDKLMIDSVAFMQREAKKEAVKKVNTLLKKNKFTGKKKDGLDFAVQDSVTRMIKAIGNPKKAIVKYKEITDNNKTYTDEQIIESEFYRMTGIIPTKLDTVAEWVELHNNLESFINDGATLWQKRQEESNERVEASRSLILDKPLPENQGTIDKVNAIKGEHSKISATFQTFVEYSNLDKTLFGRHIDQDLVFEQNVGESRKDLANVVDEATSFSFRDNSKFTNNVITITTETEALGSTEYEMTRREATQWWMWAQDPSLKEAMMDTEIGNGFTQEHIDQMEEFAGKEGMVLAKGLFEFNGRMHDKVNPGYREAFGRSLPRNKKYSSVHKLGDSSVEMSLDMDKMNVSDITSSAFEDRTGGNHALQQRDVIDNVNDYVRNIEWFIAYNQWFNEVSRLLNSDKTGATTVKLKKILGNENFKTFKKHIELMEHESSTWHSSDSKFIDTLLRNFAVSRIGASPQIMMKQMTSATASAAEIGAVNWAAGANEFFKNPKENWEFLNTHPSFEFRQGGFNPELESLQSTGERPMLKSEKFDKVRDLQMGTVRFGDKSALAVSIYAEFHHNTTNLGMNEVDALDKAVKNGQKTQQSNLPSQRTLSQKDSNTYSKVVNVFTTGPLALTNAVSRYTRQYLDGKITKTEAARKIAVIHFITLSFEFIRSGFDLEPEEIAAAAITGPVGAIPLFGNAVNVGIAQALDVGFEAAGLGDPAKPFTERALGEDTLAGVVGSVGGLIEVSFNAMFTDKPISMLEVTEMLTDSIDLTTGLSTRNILDELVGIGYIIEGEEGGIRKAIGLSDFVIEQDKDSGSSKSNTTSKFTGV